MCSRVGRIVIEQRSQHRRASTSGLLEQGVEVWQQAVTQLQRASAERLDLLAAGPRRVVAGAFGGIAAREWVQTAQLHPARIQLRAAVLEEPANIRPAEG